MVKRVFYIHGVNAEKVRGGHKHTTLKQFLVCTNGRYQITVHDGRNRNIFILDDPTKGLLLEPDDWHTMKCLKTGSTLMVLANEVYGKDVYINHQQLSSLSIFFPFLNDEKTVERQIKFAYQVGQQVAKTVEVIALHGGASKDNTWRKILAIKKKYPKLKVIDKSDNREGYAVIKYALIKAKNDWVFYTDGDAQYHLEENLIDLVNKYFATGADVINGYKLNRSDHWMRVVLGKLYAYVSKFVFELPIRDADCDFRLIRRNYLDKISLEARDSSILPEMIKKLELAGAEFAEVGVHHYSRIWGTSNYATPWVLLKEKLIGDIKMYFKLRRYEGGGRNQRLIRFLGVGAMCTLLQIVLYNMILPFGINPGIAAFASDQLPIYVSFVLNSKLTFRSNMHGKFWPYYLTVIVSTLIQSVTVYGFTYFAGHSWIMNNVAFVVGQSIATLWNYLVQSRVVWKGFKLRFAL